MYEKEISELMPEMVSFFDTFIEKNGYAKEIPIDGFVFSDEWAGKARDLMKAATEKQEKWYAEFKRENPDAEMASPHEVLAAQRIDRIVSSQWKDCGEWFIFSLFAACGMNYHDVYRIG